MVQAGGRRRACTPAHSQGHRPTVLHGDATAFGGTQRQHENIGQLEERIHYPRKVGVRKQEELIPKPGSKTCRTFCDCGIKVTTVPPSDTGSPARLPPYSSSVSSHSQMAASKGNGVLQPGDSIMRLQARSALMRFSCRAADLGAAKPLSIHGSYTYPVHVSQCLPPSAQRRNGGHGAATARHTLMCKVTWAKKERP